MTAWRGEIFPLGSHRRRHRGQHSGALFNYWVAVRRQAPLLPEYGRYFLVSESRVEGGGFFIRHRRQHHLNEAGWCPSSASTSLPPMPECRSGITAFPRRWARRVGLALTFVGCTFWGAPGGGWAHVISLGLSAWRSSSPRATPAWLLPQASGVRRLGGYEGSGVNDHPGSALWSFRQVIARSPVQRDHPPREGQALGPSRTIPPPEFRCSRGRCR